MKIIIKSMIVLNIIVFSVYCQYDTSNQIAKDISNDSMIHTVDIRIGLCFKNEITKDAWIQLNKKINKNYRYYAFSREGKIIISSSSFRYKESEGCDKWDIRKEYFMVPENYNDSLNYYTFTPFSPSCLVIGSNGEIDFQPLKIHEINNETKNICLQKIFTATGLDSTEDYTIAFHSSGFKQGVYRYFIELSSKLSEKDGVVAIVDIEKAKYSIKYLKSSISAVRKYFLSGQADTDSDGLSDAFSLDFGDYEGSWLLINFNGKWKLVTDSTLMGPC